MSQITDRLPGDGHGRLGDDDDQPAVARGLEAFVLLFQQVDQLLHPAPGLRRG